MNRGEAPPMTDETKRVQAFPPLTEHRETTIACLQEAFSTGHLTLDAYEARVTAAENASTGTELANLVADLPKSTMPTVSDAESVHCRMATKELSGSTLRTKKLVLDASMSSLTINYVKNEPIKGVQELCVDLNMSTLVLHLPDDVVVDNRVQESMSSFKEYRNKYYDPTKPRTSIILTGSSKMSTIHVKRKRYWFFSKKK
jgi:hypothetical protein